MFWTPCMTWTSIYLSIYLRLGTPCGTWTFIYLSKVKDTLWDLDLYLSYKVGDTLWDLDLYLSI